jgi:hypothetical protein
MAKKIQVWQALGPRLAVTEALAAETLVERLISTTNQTRGSILAVLAELDTLIEEGLKEGRIVKLPNGTSYRPTGKKDGSINVTVHLNAAMQTRINAGQRAKWENAANINKSEAELIAQWNAAHPDDLVEED